VKKYIVLFLIILVLLPLPALAGDEIKINKLIKNSDGKVQLEGRTYKIENPIVMKSDVTLLGIKGKTKFLLKAGVPWSVWVPVVDGVNLKNCRIAYITFDMNSEKQKVKYGKGYHNGIFLKGCSNIEVDHCSFINGKGDGARFKTCSNLKIHDNTAKLLGHDGIFVVDCKDVKIYNNRITTRTNSGIRDWNSQNVLISKNKIDAQLDGYGGYAGIQIEYSKFFNDPNVEICKNVMTETWGPGAQFIAYDDGLDIDKGITVKQNQFIRTGQSNYIEDTGGISIKGLKGITIANNIGDGCRNSFVFVMSGGENSVIKNNIIANTLPHVEINQPGTGYGVANIAGTSFSAGHNCFWNNENGNTYRINSKNNDFKDPKKHKTSSGWVWNKGKWIYSGEG
jgi:hypothetical protein